MHQLQKFGPMKTIPVQNIHQNVCSKYILYCQTWRHSLSDHCLICLITAPLNLMCDQELVKMFCKLPNMSYKYMHAHWPNMKWHSKMNCAFWNMGHKDVHSVKIWNCSLRIMSWVSVNIQLWVITWYYVGCFKSI